MTLSQMNRISLSCSLWLEFVYTEYCHDVIYVQTFNDATSYLWLVRVSLVIDSGSMVFYNLGNMPWHLR